MSPDERRSSIIEAATPLLVERGEKVTTQEIAAAAGIAEGTIFRVFPTKDDLVSAVLEVAMDPGPTEQAIADLPVGPSLDETVESVVGILQRRGEATWQLLTSVGMDFHRRRGMERRRYTDSPALEKVLTRYRQELDTTPGEAAWVLISMVLALTHPAMTEKPLSSERVTAVYLRGVGRC